MSFNAMTAQEKPDRAIANDGFFPELSLRTFLDLYRLPGEYAADLVATTIAAAGLAAELEALEKIADGIHAVSDAMTGLIGSTAMDADQKLDESRLQLKLAGAELRTAGARLSVHEMRQMTRAARAKAEEAIQAARMALPSGAEQQQRLARLAAELEARAEEMQAQLQAQLQRRGPRAPHPPEPPGPVAPRLPTQPAGRGGPSFIAPPWPAPGG